MRPKTTDPTTIMLTHNYDTNPRPVFEAQLYSTHQTHRFRMKIRKDLIHIARSESVPKYFGEHGTVVEENFETAWPRDVQGV